MLDFGFEQIEQEKGLTCFGCGREYKGVDCNCGKGLDYNKYKKTVTYWNNYSAPYDVDKVMEDL